MPPEQVKGRCFLRASTQQYRSKSDPLRLHFPCFRSDDQTPTYGFNMRQSRNKPQISDTYDIAAGRGEVTIASENDHECVLNGDNPRKLLKNEEEYRSIRDQAVRMLATGAQTSEAKKNIARTGAFD